MPVGRGSKLIAIGNLWGELFNPCRFPAVNAFCQGDGQHLQFTSKLHQWDLCEGGFLVASWCWLMKFGVCRVFHWRFFQCHYANTTMRFVGSPYQRLAVFLRHLATCLSYDCWFGARLCDHFFVEGTEVQIKTSDSVEVLKVRHTSHTHTHFSFEPFQPSEFATNTEVHNIGSVDTWIEG